MCQWFEKYSRAGAEAGEAMFSMVLSGNLGTDCSCAVHRMPAGVWRVSRNLKQNNLLLVIMPQAEMSLHSIKVTDAFL